MNSKQRRRYIRANIGAATARAVALKLAPGEYTSESFVITALKVFRNEHIPFFGRDMKFHYVRESLRTPLK